MTAVRILDGAPAEPAHNGREAAAAVATLIEGAVEGLHREFLAAGAQIVRTCTGPLGRWRCNMEGIPEHFANANQRAAAAAVAARDAVAPGALVAGTLGPVRARYEPDLLPPAELIERETIEQVLVLAPHVDLFLCETMTLGAEAAAMARAALSTGRPVWVSFTFHERGPLATRGGETPAQALAALDGLAVDAILVNCTSAEMVADAIADFAALRPGTPIGGYANGFETVGAAEANNAAAAEIGGRIAMTPAGYARFARAWIDAGATIVGGCCDVGPAHIAALKKLAEEEQ